jgi:polar amino acid transport system substrate-binding protein
MRSALRSSIVLLAAVAVAACTTAGSSPSASAVATAAASPSAAAPSVAASPSADACAKDSLTTMSAGKLTIGADNPAFPPYFSDDPADPAWESGNPNNGKGFESAVAYEIAKGLGFETADVTWVPVPFNSAIAPGDKPFDLYLTQVSYSAERAEAVDLSDGYLDQSQTVIALADNPIAAVTTVDGLKAFKLGAPIGTTSYDYIVENIKPTTEASVYDTLDAAIQALSVKQIDGVLVDLPTAFFATAVQLENGKIVGTLPTVGEVEHFSVVLDKDSPLTDCVNTALAAMTSDGTLKSITDEWITGSGAPELK